MDVTTTIPNWAKDDILRASPVPLDETDQPLYTEVEWIDKVFEDYAKQLYTRGRNMKTLTDNPPPPF